MSGFNVVSKTAHVHRHGADVAAEANRRPWRRGFLLAATVDFVGIGLALAFAAAPGGAAAKASALNCSHRLGPGSKATKRQATE